MKKLIALLAFLATPLAAETTVPDWQAAPEQAFLASDVDIDAFKWQARPIVIFADSALDPAYIEQIELLNAEINEVTERDILILVDTDPKTPSALRSKLRPRGFTFVLIGKDGGVKLRKPFPWDVREITRVIDKMPLRKKEIEDRRPPTILQ